MNSIARRTFNWITISTLAVPFFARASSAAEKQTPGFLTTGSYNYRVRFIRKKRSIAAWAYVVDSVGRNAEIPVKLVLMTTPDLKSGTDPRTSPVIHTESKTTALRSNSTRFRYKLSNGMQPKGSKVYIRLLLGESESPTKAWQFFA